MTPYQVERQVVILFAICICCVSLIVPIVDALRYKKNEAIYKTPEFKSLVAPRAYKLNYGDVFVLNDIGVKQAFGIPIKDIELGTKLQYGIVCIEKIKRRWWQFWKPKYWGAKFVYVEKENSK
jgi:hypothetical protein